MKVGIAGGGIMGQLMAFSLFHAGWQVTLFDAANTANCSMVAAGLLSPIAELEKNDLLIYKMGIKALFRYWPEIIRHLPEEIYFKTAGSLLVAHPHDRMALQHTASIIKAKLSSAQEICHLNQDNIISLEPAITQFNEGYYLLSEGQIDNQHLIKVLKNYLLNARINWQHTVISDVSAGCIEVGTERYLFDLVIDCRGLGAKKTYPTLRGLRGELVWLKAPQVQITRPIRFLHPRYALYIVPRNDNVYLIGASEIEAEDYSSISVRTLLELLTAAYYVNANFSEARVMHTVTECRPTLIHHLPEIVYSDGLIAINGLYRHGYLIAPTLAADTMNYVREGFKGLLYSEIWKKTA